jgi:prepilin-type N-terminal cleavage/methylation domain-containing protein
MKHSAQSGFTLIEIIVSLGVFSTVVTIAVGALLVLVAANQQLQNEQSVMTNLSFALDSMTREIRTGTAYNCDTEASISTGGPNNFFQDGRDLDTIVEIDDYDDCDGPQGNQDIIGLSFVESGDSISGSNDRVLYFFDDSTGIIYRRVGTEDAMAITSPSSGAIINDFSFWVTGSEPLEGAASGRLLQPTVTIFIDASNVSNPSKHYYLQTTVTQRTLDL